MTPRKPTPPTPQQQMALDLASERRRHTITLIRLQGLAARLDAALQAGAIDPDHAPELRRRTGAALAHYDRARLGGDEEAA